MLTETDDPCRPDHPLAVVDGSVGYRFSQTALFRSAGGVSRARVGFSARSDPGKNHRARPIQFIPKEVDRTPIFIW